MLERVLSIRLDSDSNGANLVAEARTTKNSFDSISKQLFLYEQLSPQAASHLTSVLQRWSIAEKQLPLIAFDTSNPKELARLEQSISSIFSEINLVGNEVAAQGNQASEKNLATLRLVREYRRRPYCFITWWHIFSLARWSTGLQTNLTHPRQCCSYGE